MTYNNKIDVDAVAFIAKGITNVTHQKAVNYLCVELKKANLWNKMVAIYPLVGGTAALHAWNLKNLSKHNITWGSGVTHSAQGVVNNSGQSTLNLHSNDIANIGTSFHAAFYFHTNSQPTRSSYVIAHINMAESGDSNSIYAAIPHSDGRIYYCHSSGMVVNGRRLKFALCNKLGQSQAVYIDGSSAVSANTTPRATISQSFVLNRCGLNGSNASRMSFISLGSGFTDAEQATLYNIVQQYQTILGRAV